MFKRVLTSIIMVPLAAVVIYGGLPLRIAVAVFALLGMQEVCRAFSGGNRLGHAVGYVYAAAYIMFVDAINGNGIMAVFLLLFTLNLLILPVIFHKSVSVTECAYALFAFFYVAMMLSSVYAVRQGNNGTFTVWLIFITAWGCDTGGYITGYFFGRHKLVPKLSPKKTVEGAVGGIVFSVVMAVIYGVVLGCLGKGFFSIPVVITIGAVGAVFAQFGDLLASAIKRYTKIKDFGSILPGHGGIVDRFDSVLFTAPVVLIAVQLLERLAV